MALATSPHMVAPEVENARCWCWWDIALMLLLTVVLLIGGVVVAVVAMIAATGNWSDPTPLLSSLPFMMTVGAIQGLAMVAAVYAAMRWRRMTWADLWLVTTHVRWLLIGVGAAIGLRLLMFPVGYLLQFTGLSSENPQLAFLAPEGFSWAGLIGMSLVGGVLIPFAEEVLFRGVIYTYLRRWGVVVAALVSSLVFAAAHMDLMIGIVAFLLGLGIALVYERSKSLWVAYVVHAVFNILGIVLLYGALAFGVSLPGAA